MVHRNAVEMERLQVDGFHQGPAHLADELPQAGFRAPADVHSGGIEIPEVIDVS